MRPSEADLRAAADVVFHKDHEDLHRAVAEAIAKARREGREEMRERAAKDCEVHIMCSPFRGSKADCGPFKKRENVADGNIHPGIGYAASIRALPTEGE